MTHKQKADELVERFRKYAHVPYHDNNPIIEEETKNAIQCAIICVEEILSEQPDTVHGYTNEGQLLVVDNFRKYYWQSVLNELKSRL